MDAVKMKGKTVEEAVEAALEVLKLTKDQVEVKVLSEGGGGMLGFGGKDAEVEVSPKKEAHDFARATLQQVLDMMGFLSLVSIKSHTSDAVILDVKGEDMGRIIGREGAGLDALSVLLAAMTSKRSGQRVRVTIDAGDYREKQEKRIQQMAQDAIEQVEATGEEMVLPPMSPAERRVIHLFLQDNPKISSFSRGERSERRVVVAPRGKEKELQRKAENELPEN